MNLLEGLAAGTTTFADYSTPIHEIAQFFSQLGARARLTSHIREVPDDVQHLLKDGDLYPFDEQKGRESLEENVRLIEEWHGYETTELQHCSVRKVQTSSVNDYLKRYVSFPLIKTSVSICTWHRVRVRLNK